MCLPSCPISAEPRHLAGRRGRRRPDRQHGDALAATRTRRAKGACSRYPSIFFDGEIHNQSAAAPSATTLAKSNAWTHPKCCAMIGVSVGEITPPRLLPVFIRPPVNPALLPDIWFALAQKGPSTPRSRPVHTARMAAAKYAFSTRAPIARKIAALTRHPIGTIRLPQSIPNPVLTSRSER